MRAHAALAVQVAWSTGTPEQSDVSVATVQALPGLALVAMHFLVEGLQSPGLPAGIPTHTPAVQGLVPSPLVQSVWLTLPTAPQKQATGSSGLALHATMSAGGQQSMTFWERLQMLCDSP